MSVVALVPAAGTGSRLAAGQPKAFLALAGIPLVVRAVRGLLDSAVVDAVVVAAPPQETFRAEDMLGGLATVVAGGAERAASVRVALAEAELRYPAAEVILVHDAARALTPSSLVRELVAAVRSGAAAVVPVLPLADTVKCVDLDGRVSSTLDRSQLRIVQTPQAFAPVVLRRAYAAAGSTGATDDAGLVEALGEPVLTVPGHPLAFKITTPWDMALAERLAAP